MLRHATWCDGVEILEREICYFGLVVGHNRIVTNEYVTFAMYNFLLYEFVQVVDVVVPRTKNASVCNQLSGRLLAVHFIDDAAYFAQ